ncbi:Similar to Vps13: Vacuolar protein sorting-associated protein 13 (Drosophila melanogaster) [Cotesia congregata]|uniref:Similar to Vps13: Vacuolar protein sorting-associated protein 13 (Drosophila melanogaster) n=1 Tax=Cotesia congregata TaxID=51543 RepID=A0A8J2EKU1_COTCN|nr:Similar to Vps13: Vacuolar protein sorting-associated protein 13 (Drosophila melanogaster) [Cotesia congregata]
MINDNNNNNNKVSKLILKIPFKDIWNGQIDCIIEELYLLIVPSSQVKYDPEKEAKYSLDAKHAELARIEKNKQLLEQSKQAEKIDDSMLEKLLARMIKNIHVEIKSIHVRYEDHVTFKPHEFAIGLTLNRLALESCNTSWMTTENMKDMYLIPQIFKLLTLDGFSIYLNPSLMQFSKQASSTYLKLFHDSIATTENIPPDYQYLLGPINVKAKLKLNPKPETDGSNYQIPKVWLDLEMEKLRIGLTKRQYATLLQLGEGLDRAKKAAPFRKFRPDVPSYRGHYKEWWQFAYKCVLEEHVVRCRRNWNWAHMKEHRDLCREYAEVYQTKLTSKKPVPAIEERLTHCERHLDLFNLVVIRQQIELEVERLAEKQKSIKAERGWFGFLWGSSQQKEEEELNSAAAIMKKFQDAMTPAEKEKLYRAIDYQENSAPAHYPEHYEMVDMMFYLHGLQIIVSDTDKEEPSVLDVALNGVRSAFKLRPAANSVFVTVSLKEMRMLGVKQADEVPKLVLSEHEHSDVLFSVSYEKNPLDKSCGDRVIVNSKAVHFVYDAQTIIELVKLFKIQQAAAERLEGLKEMSALGLEYAIQKHSQLDIQVDLEASQLIVPQNGFYREKESMIVINLGSLKIHTLAKPKDEMSSQTVRQLVSMGKSEEDIMSHLREHSYDRFALKIVNFQALVVTKNEDWRVGLSMSSSPMVILQPTTLEIQFHKCLVTDDPVLPKMRIIGELPSLALCIPGTRLLEAVSIVQSIPFPEDESELQPMPLAKSMSQLSINYVKELAKPVVELTEDVVVQTTDLEAKFVMQEFTLTIFKTEEVQPFIKVEDIKLRLGGIQVTQYHKDEKIFMINTPMTSGHQVYLIVLNFMAVNKRSPEFTTRHGSVVNLLRLEFTTLDVLLHQESLISVLKYINEVQDKVTPCSSLESRVATTRDKFSQLSTIQEDTSMFFKDQQKKAKSRSKKVVVECIDLKIKAKFGTISLKIANDKQEISAFLIQGITAGYIMKVSYSQANVNLTSIIIQDLNPKSIYNNIVSVESGESLQVQAVIYNVEAHENKNNMSIKINMGCHRVVFLNDFVSRVMNFLNNFQAAQEAIAEASAAAAEVAKTNIKDAQASATRVELSIKLKAPVIYVPMNSKSEHCLMLDMGELTIYNSLKTLNVEEEEAPVVDEMKIELANLKLSRVRLTENFQMENEILLLQPVSFGLLIKRNLSSWYTSIPDIDMYGRLKQIEVLLSKQDYAMILKVLEENLNESDESPGQKETARERKDIQRTNAREVDVHITERQTSEGQKSARASVKFEFIMDSFVINLFTGGSKLLQSKTSPLHLPENGLAQFGLTHFAVKGTIFADGLLATSILLMNCTLDDKRQNRQGQLTRIMERTNPLTDAEENSKRSMLDVTIRQSVNDIFVDVKVFSFSIIVSLDYLLKIKDFFTIQAVQTQPQVTVQKYTEVKKKAAASNQSMITLNLHIEKPDIILMEDMDNIDCNCIVMNTELVIKVRLIGDHQVINGSVTDLSVLTGIYNPTKRADSAYQVLKPFSVSIAGSTPDNKGLHIDICCTDIHVSVSPGVIEILSRVMRGLTSSDEQADQFIRPDPSHQGLWLITPYDESEYWFLKTEVATEAFEELNFVEDSVVAYKPELAIVSAPNILLTLEAGVGNKTLPMLMLNLGFQSSVNDWSTRTMSIEATISVIMAYYNSRLALWEPLIEPVEVLRQNGERNSSSWELRSKIQFHDLAPDSRGASAVSPSCESEPEDLHQSKMSIDVDSSENLEITVTKTCFEVMEQLSKAFTSAMDAKESVPRLAPYVLKNETGLKLTLDLQASNFVILDKNLQPEGKEDDKYKEVVLETAATIQLAPLVDKRDSVMLEQMRTSVQMNNDYNLMINFDGIDNQLVIPVLRADKRFFSLKYRKESSEEWGIISDVVVENGSTVVALRSVLQVHNHFTETVSVYYMTKRGNEVECVGNVKPEEKLSLPLDAVYTPTNIYWLFFSVEGYMVSVEPFVWKDLQKTLSMTKLLKCEPRNKQSKEPFYMQVVGEIEQVYFENTTRHTMSSTIYNIHLYPSVYLKNFLPIDIVIILPGMVEEKVVKASTTIQLPTVDSNNSNIIIKVFKRTSIDSGEKREWSSYKSSTTVFAYAVSLALESFRYVNAFSRDKVLTDKCTSLINGGKTKPTPVEEEIFYVSFLDGFQRVLLFTNNLKIAEDCQLVGDLEVIDQEVTLNIHGVGLSLVNNLTRAELLYLRIASSGIIWETRKTIGSRWKPLTSTEVLVIEEGYQKYLREVQLGTEPPYRVMLEPKLMVDFQNMEMLRPHRRYMRRTFQTGLWIQYRSSAHQVQLHAKINRLQIDNQLAECVFPVILAPVPPPKSVANSVIKPFAELSLVKRLLEHSTVQQFRYFKFLIQEFHVKVNDAEETRLFAVDMKLVDEPLMYHVAMITTAEQKNFFDLLHFSPLKIHVSFSMTGGGGGPSAVPQFLNVLLQGIGVTLTDINDIVFKFGYFERDYVFMTNNQLINEATSHYTGQGIKQLYVLVLGLDVIGNPYGLVVGAMKGVEDLFYEPFQGAIQGPGEFAEGLLLGVRSMLGHTVGGMAGAVSKITGAMGKGLAALTFDKDYQRKRQEGLNKQPANLQEGLARSGKGLVMGFVDGVTGVVMKPISGAKEEGVEGFFKGFGKGVVGLVTRPTAGAIDFASGSFGAVRRATELSEEVKRVRPPRFLRPDCLVRPFIHAEAEGNKILFDLEKGKYANTDVYFHHTFVGKDVLLMTDKRIAYIEHSDLFGGWKVQWGYTWQEITEPRIIEKGVQISVKEARKKKLGGLFGSDAAGKIILISDLAVKHQVFNIIRDKIEKIES